MIETAAPSNPRLFRNGFVHLRKNTRGRGYGEGRDVLKTETKARTARVLAQSHPSQSNGSTYRSVSGIRSDGNKTICVIVSRNI